MNIYMFSQSALFLLCAPILWAARDSSLIFDLFLEIAMWGSNLIGWFENKSKK